MNRYIYRFLKDVYRVSEQKILGHFPDSWRHTIRQKALTVRNRHFRRTGHSRPTVPLWVVEEMDELCREIDPMLFSSNSSLADLEFGDTPIAPKMGQAYARIASNLSGKYSHCFILPWLQFGGADIGAIHHITAVSEFPNTKILVVLTEDEESPWLSRVPNSIDIVKLNKKETKLELNERISVLTRILIQLKPHTIHNINSMLGWEMIMNHGDAVRQESGIYASLFCRDYNEENRDISYSAIYLPKCYQYIKKIITDNKTFQKSLSDQYGYSKSLFHTLYFPTQIIRSSSSFISEHTGKILWAGRWSRQKRLDLLVGIASALPKMTFLVYGRRSLDSDFAAISALQKLPNVEMRGGYDGFSSLPVDECDLFLYTSQWDGLPNVILEAASCCLPIVTSGVGGIGELISERTGYLIEPYDSVPAFVAAINQVVSNKAEAHARAVAAFDAVKARHSFAVFKKSLADIPGYIRIQPDKPEAGIIA